MQFRNDISGLRAWAVLLVVLYHFNVPGVGSGFVGVDIFFVISGFLMGGILDRTLRDPNRRRFWYFDFLLARAQRIWPALLFMTALWMLWGWLRLGPEEFRIIALEGLRAIFFRSNAFYAEQADYFAAAADIRLFLHSWSLSVEWMFYMGLAALALVCSWLTRRPAVFMAGVIALSLGSFLWMLLLRRSDATEAFFFLAPRAWEMGAGVLAFYAARHITLSSRTAKGLPEVTGFALIGASLFLATAFGVWPGPVTLLPVLGTALILIAANQGSPLTAPAPLQGLGEISYSLYLWHWPISVALSQVGLLEDPLWQAAGIAASLLAGLASWALIERPARRALTGRGRLFKSLVLLGAVLATGLIFGAIRKLDGFPARLPAEVRATMQRVASRHPLDAQCLNADGLAEPCRIGPKEGAPDLVILGDSHAGALLGPIAEATAAGGQRIDVLAHQRCQPIFDVQGAGGRLACADFMDAAEARLKTVPASVPLLIISRLPWSVEGENADGLRRHIPEIWVGDAPAAFSDSFRQRMADALTAGICRIGAGRRIYVMAPVPEMRRHPLRELEAAAIRGVPFIPPSLPLSAVEARTRRTLDAVGAAQRQCGAELLPVTDLLCPEGICNSWRAGEFLYRDDDHLSLAGAARVLPALDPALKLR